MQNEAVDRSKVTRAQLRTSLSEKILNPATLMLTMAGMAGAGYIWPATLPISIIAIPGLMIAFTDRKYRAPLRMPQDCDLYDETLTRESNEESRWLFFRNVSRKMVRVKAKGIFYLGYERGRLFGREVWLTLSDCLRHMSLFGTTGAGKTDTFYGFIVNALCWNRGYSISDGKADNKLAFANWSLCRRFGREEDFYVLNLLTGSIDRFEKMITNEGELPQSNNVNLFAVAPPTFIIQLMESMLPAVGGDGAQWQDSAKAMMTALINALCYKRARGELQLSQRVIQRYLPLTEMAALYLEAKENKWHKEGYEALETYLANVPGFQFPLAASPELWDTQVYQQHGFLSRQFIKTLSLFNETYGHVFPEDSGDIIMRDILHNDRILVVLIPSTELSRAEAATLGKLYITMQRMTISQDLGYHLEGNQKDVMLTHSLGHKFPYMLDYDEVGQYFADGIDTLFAQMRGLGYMGVASSQDLPGMARGANGQEKSLMANTRTKYFMSIEDEETFEVLRKAVGRDYFSELSTLNRKPGDFSESYEDDDKYQIREKDRIDIREMRTMKEGEGVISFQDALVRNAAFYIEDSDKLSSRLPMRINRFVEVLAPNASNLKTIWPELHDTEENRNEDELWYNLPPVSLNNYDRRVNALLENIECFYETRVNSMSTAELSVCLFEIFDEWLDGTGDTPLYQLQDDPFPAL